MQAAGAECCWCHLAAASVICVIRANKSSAGLSHGLDPLNPQFATASLLNLQKYSDLDILIPRLSVAVLEKKHQTAEAIDLATAPLDILQLLKFQQRHKLWLLVLLLGAAIVMFVFLFEAG